MGLPKKKKQISSSNTIRMFLISASTASLVILNSIAIVSQALSSSQTSSQLVMNQYNHQQQQVQVPISQQEESELMRQKQHIQYHDQWPSTMAGKCRKRTLNFCASVLPFNSTTFPNIIGDTNRFEVKRSLPFFGFLAKSSCNKRLDELLCLLLEPPCQQQTGLVIPPCKKFCRLALEGCSEYIPATLAMSSVFDCRQYPDSSDPNVCINLASGSRCAQDEFKCPDKTCIPKNWLCDGVRDCLFAADEANCTGPAGVEPQASVCSTEEFKCDGKCVPKAWKCDGERDCLDGTDEESCDRRPRCGPDRFRCADGNGCLPKRWVCDGKAECRDGSDELNCEQRECSENDFKCDNGICIPKIWKCDRQFDCKDGSDERGCIFPTTTTSTTTSAPTTTQLMVNISLGSFYQLPLDSNSDQYQQQQDSVKKADGHIYSTEYNTVATVKSSADSLADNKQLGASLNEDVSRIIQQESTGQQSISPSSETGAKGDNSASASAASEAAREAEQQAKEMKKFDYDLLPSASSSSSAVSPNSIINQHSDEAGQLAQVSSEQPTNNRQQQMLTQVDFVAQPPPPQQQQQPAHNGFRRRTSKPVQPAVGTGGASSIVERVPIYRSLFKKTLKSDSSPRPSSANQAQQQLQSHSPVAGVSNQQPPSHRYAVRRRRDRAQQRQRQSVAGQTSSLPAPQPQEQSAVAPSSLADMAGGGGGAIKQQQQQNQTTTRAANSHGVASYLQLLNNRYNFRLNRAAHSQQPQQQQQQQQQQSHHHQSPHSVFVPSS